MANIFGAQNTGLPHDTFLERAGKPQRDGAYLGQTRIVVAEHDGVGHDARLITRKIADDLQGVLMGVGALG